MFIYLLLQPTHRVHAVSVFRMRVNISVCDPVPVWVSITNRAIMAQLEWSYETIITCEGLLLNCGLLNRTVTMCNSGCNVTWFMPVDFETNYSASVLSAFANCTVVSSHKTMSLQITFCTQDLIQWVTSVIALKLNY